LIKVASTAMFYIAKFRFTLFLIAAWMLWPQALCAQTRLSPSQPVARPTMQVAPASPRALDLFATVSLADIGFTEGFRFGNLGGRREVFVPLPQGGEAVADEFVLVLDDVSAYDARRNLIVMINDRVAAIGLDGHSTGRVVRIPVPKVKTKDGFLKLTFIYSGAATQDRCIDVRSVGDSLIIRPESAVEVDVGPTNALDIPTTVALLPHEVAILLPKRRLSPTEIATAVTVARALAASGHRTSFVQGAGALPEVSKVGETRRWTRGLIMVGQIDDVATFIDAPLATVAGPIPALGSIRGPGFRRSGPYGLRGRRRRGRTAARQLLARRHPRTAGRPGGRGERPGLADRPGDFRSDRDSAGRGRSIRPRRSHVHGRHTAAASGAPTGAHPARRHGRARWRRRSGRG